MKVAIIGGGALGLTLANILEENSIDYELFERSLIGRKLLASGNGRANIGNINIKEDKYNNSFGYNLVTKHKDNLFDFWKKIGLHIKVDDEGRIYPYSESSLSVLQCLTKKKLNIIENYNIQSISMLNNRYYLNDVRGPFDYVAIAVGSIASFIPKKQVYFYDFLNDLNIKFNNITPALVGFKLDCDFKRLNGVRIKCKASLIQNSTILYQEKGEAILKNDGISGICIMNLSNIYSQLKDKRNCRVSLDLLPDFDLKINCYNDLISLLNPKLIDYLSKYNINEINNLVHNFSFLITGVYDFEFSQVVNGGVSLEEINPNLSLKKDNHIYIGGELLDICGMCGGYNLMFAFSCALEIGESICSIK